MCIALYSHVLSPLQTGSAAREVGTGMLVEHSGRAPRLEMVSFKKLNRGTLLLGVVFKVSQFSVVNSQKQGHRCFRLLLYLM